MKKKHLVKRAFYWVVLMVLLIVAGLTAASVLEIPGDYRFLTVLSGSMEPSIKTGSIVVVQPFETYVEGDVITFSKIKNINDSVTHRVVEVKEEDGKKNFVTKGDANNAPDLGEISSDKVFGKVVLAIPYVGRLINFTRTMQGMILLIVVPAVIIIYDELKNIKKELLKIKKNIVDRSKKEK